MEAHALALHGPGWELTLSGVRVLLAGRCEDGSEFGLDCTISGGRPPLGLPLDLARKLEEDIAGYCARGEVDEMVSGMAGKDLGSMATFRNVTWRPVTAEEFRREFAAEEDHQDVGEEAE